MVYMKESEKQNLFITFKGVIESVIKEKKENPKEKIWSMN